MSQRLQFKVTNSEASDAIAAALVPLTNAGWTVRVEVPDDGTDHLGWRVILDRPGHHRCCRMRADASPEDWANWVATLLQSTSS